MNLLQDFNVFEDMVRQLKVSGVSLNENDLIIQLLRSLDNSYKPVVNMLTTMNNNLMLEFVKTKLLDFETAIELDEMPKQTVEDKLKNVISSNSGRKTNMNKVGLNVDIVINLTIVVSNVIPKTSTNRIISHSSVLFFMLTFSKI